MCDAVLLAGPGENLSSFECLKRRLREVGAGGEALVRLMLSEMDPDDVDAAAAMIGENVHGAFSTFAAAAGLDLDKLVCGDNGSYAHVYPVRTDPGVVWRVNRYKLSRESLGGIHFAASVRKEDAGLKYFALPTQAAVFIGTGGPTPGDPCSDSDVKGDDSITLATSHERALGTLSWFARSKPTAFDPRVYDEGALGDPKSQEWSLLCGEHACNVIHCIYAAARLGWVHVDLKPDNMLAFPEGVTKLCDLDSMYPLGVVLCAHEYNHPMMLPPDAVRRIGKNGKSEVDHRFVSYQAGLIVYYLLAHHLYIVPEAAQTTKTKLLVATLTVQGTLRRHQELEFASYFETALERIRDLNEGDAGGRVVLELIMFGLLVPDCERRLTLCEAKWLLYVTTCNVGADAPDDTVCVKVQLRPCWERPPSDESELARYNFMTRSVAQRPFRPDTWWVHLSYYGGPALFWYRTAQFSGGPDSIEENIQASGVKYELVR